ncbi:uncharacterized protein BO72DRAFT_498378 [Aspergillus fijiensis CBS 313.89]|uniref:Uncharacterized protein n=1 Tax=Aspergillus fijiensis CBS 313.89 TaxID=1448319 RepID=A0A8G1RM18_9EURO|nr:uncharacterized protein BO72DRAFT_498378 [Aspergillus fijiensis CBS 313.89]RAK75239.1 hypothetical protein BO72DRAFT_498378 [Aspergillus fijiensis CBS 313.89]
MAPSTTYQYQPIITAEADLPTARKRRTIYLRPFLLFYLSSLVAETIFLAVGVFIMSGTRDLFYKVLWTLAAHFTGILSLLVLSSCNYLCYNLDRNFGWFGATEHPMWFHWRYPMIWGVGYANGLLLFTDEGQKKLARWGL